ncbi:thiosulfate:glutathione sulfurtransferase-like [Ambystoma mexicanum]|uniref:thiosulfate:glutathione sulfurtransferase-like n=1 Tax=Ambystoma mexicanum TaxID=8296 RepID=UPI0037E83BE3
MATVSCLQLVKRACGMFHLRRLLQSFGVGRTQGRLSTADIMSKVKEISYDNLKKVTTTGDVLIVDVRSPEEVSNGKIPASVNIPVDEFDQALKMNPEDFKKKFSVDKPKPEHNLIVHCQMGRRGARAAEIAMGQGYSKVQNYAGGYKEWSDKGGH